MKLNKLILHGFKSFADKTEFDFREGITVIVGPNGCGKSNVVDAVKWVLGEQRPTSLRGKEMQDVIFSGTDSRKGVGFAEVSLVLDNTEQTLPLDYDEVQITRRLYRSGESEYLINGNPARLRDIRELMMDSGGGPGALTVMEQGNIDRLLRADPQERRLVFEEAAGISKYRARRKETERKLERTNDNLNRLRDILGEYETRQRSLKIQAGKARRFQEMTEELKRKRLAGALARYAELSRRREESVRELEAIGQAEKEARQRLESAVDGGSDQRKELDALKESVSQDEREMGGLVGEGRAQAEKRAAREREIEELFSRAEKAREEAAAARERADSFAGQIDEARHDAAAAHAGRGGRAEALAAADALLAEVEQRVALMRRERDMLDMRRTDAFAAETEARNEEIATEAEIRALRGRLERLQQKQRTTLEDLTALKRAQAEQDEQTSHAEEALKTLEERASAAEQGLRQARAAAEARAGELSALIGDQQALEARQEVLAGLVAGGEGLDAGTKALLEASAEGRLQGLQGTLADHVGDAGKDAARLDQALGELASAIVVDTTEHALEAISWLKQGRRGRARLIPMDRVGEPLIDALVRQTRIVDSVEDAVRASENPGRIVVLTGEEFEACGAIVGGTGAAGAGLVLRNAELAEVEARLEAARDTRESAQRARDEAKSDAIEWEETLDELQPRLRSARDDVRQAGQRLAAAQKAAASRAEEIDLESAESEDVLAATAECRARMESAQKAHAQAAQDREALERESEELKQRLTAGAQERERASSKQTDARIEAARWAEKAEAADQRIAALDASIRAAEREGDSRAAEAELCLARRVECLDEIAVIDRLGEERELALARLTKRIEQRRAEVRAMAEQLEQGDVAVRELRSLHEQHREELERHRLKESELRLRAEALLDQVRRDHGLDLQRVRAEQAQAQPAEDEQATEPEPIDPETLEREVEELRQKLERLGNVNHAALEQLAEVEEKLVFMKREESDLVAAERQLRETIEKIDDVCTTRFSETFESVRENFKTVFRKLFGGGKAEITLEDPDDVLNSGIEIRVRPPGKELRNMALLSGGEKSLTTVALLFSIYQTKPPPFCLLDEVDAALDEANTVRMCEMLKEFATRGQFLIITHARPTMTVADTLYGVTMPEAGVSRRVAVRFQDIEAGKVVGLN